MNNDQCAPPNIYNDGSCFKLDDLILLSNDINEAIQKGYIKKDIISIKNNKKYLLKHIINRFTECNNDHMCIINNRYLKNKNKLLEVFKPFGTTGMTDWLSTSNINAVFTRHQKLYTDFIFLGAIPIDILEIDYPVLGLNLNLRYMEIKDLNILKKNKIGIVYNLDTSKQGGSHWMALYCDIKKKQIYFFDSYGHKPNKNIRKMIHFLSNLIYHYHETGCEKNCKTKSISDSFFNEKPNNLELFCKDIDYNRTRHQYKDSECGVYSIYFILELLKGREFNELVNSNMPDDFINKKRYEYFIHN